MVKKNEAINCKILRQVFKNCEPYVPNEAGRFFVDLAAIWVFGLGLNLSGLMGMSTQPIYKYRLLNRT